MRVGGRRELIIPPALAYKNVARAKIPANSTLIFIIDLLAVTPPSSGG
jgi:FKBP-type peptidyl-prolyl cis-trans isomerase